MNNVMLIVILLLDIKLTYSQQSPDLYCDYLGQTLPGDKAVIFAPGIVSTQGLEHSAPAFSPDGKEIYWSVIREQHDTVFQDIKYIKLNGSEWTKPQTATFSGSYYDGGPFISSDGKKLYLYRDEPVPPGKDAVKISVFCYTRADDKWVKPVNLGGGFSPSFTESGTMYYGGPEGIFRMVCKDGKYSKPEYMNEQINMSGYINWTPFIAPDESYLIFSRHINKGDLFIAFHNTLTDEWTKPVDMGCRINTAGQERFPSISPDGKYMFFTRSNGNNQHDIYLVSTKVIEDIKKEVFNPKVTK